LGAVVERSDFARVEISFTGHTSPTWLRKLATYSAQHALPPRLAMDTLIVVVTVW
jgi:hypothetical protein